MARAYHGFETISCFVQEQLYLLSLQVSNYLYQYLEDLSTEIYHTFRNEKLALLPQKYTVILDEWFTRATIFSIAFANSLSMYRSRFDFSRVSIGAMGDIDSLSVDEHFDYVEFLHSARNQ